MKFPLKNGEVDALAEAVALQLAPALPSRIPGMPGLPGLRKGPGGEPDPELPPQLPLVPEYKGPLDLFLRPRLGIAGIELTQSIQHHGAAGASHGEDNSVPLVALKALVARVYPYVRPGLLASDAGDAPVTGELVLSIGNRVIYRTGPTRPAGVRAGKQSDLSRTLWDEELSGYYPTGGRFGKLERFDLNPSLNFRIPAWHCRPGRMHVAVRIWRVIDGVASGDQATATEYVWFHNVSAPKLCLVRVNWDNGMGTVTRPSDADMLATTRLAERMLPFPYFETTILGSEVTSGAAFATPGKNGKCNDAWNKLLAELGVTRIFTALFGLGDIVFGMVPQAAIPAGAKTVNRGCGKDAGGCFVGFADTFTHEIGHMYGRPHVAVKDDPDNDPDYPNYGGSKRSIGEVGLDTGTEPPTLYDPASSDDIMSYGSNRWISPYTYRKIFENRDAHQNAPADVRKVRPFLVLDIRLHRAALKSTRVELKRAFRVEAAGELPARAADAISPVSVDLLDGEGRVLATHHCHYTAAHGGGSCAGGCGDARVSLDREPYIELQEAIEWPGEEVAALAFHCGDKPFVTVPVGKPPTVAIDGPERRDGKLTVRVRARHPRATPSVAVMFTGDDGATWTPVAFDPNEGEVTIDADRLSGGARCRFRAVATAELQSAIAETETFELAPTPRRLHLGLPEGECGVKPGAVSLRAFVDTRGRGAPLPQEIRWHSSVDGEIGQGYELIAELGEGRHKLTVTMPDGLGNTLAERGIIIVGGRPR